MRHRYVVAVGVCLLAGAFNVLIPAEALTQTLPSPWLTRDIGSPSPAGSATYSNSQYSIAGSGADIWGTSDQFRFVYQQLSGDMQIVARIDSFAAADPWSKVGVMIRNDLSSGSAHAFALVSGANGVALQRRTQAGGTSYTTPGALVSAPQWVRLRRVGTTLTAWSGADGGSWQTIGSATVALDSTVYVGLAVTSHNPGSLATAVVSNVSVTSFGLPAGQFTSDIGSPAIAGSTAYSGGTYTITAAGADIWGSSDQFRYVYQQVSGDVDVIARVNSLQYTNAWSKAGVMVRETLDANSRHAMALMSAGRGYSFQWRLDPGGLAAYTSGGSGTAPAWVRLKRTGYLFEAFRSTDGISWTSFGVQSVPMASTVYVGLAVTSHNTTATTTAVMDGFQVTSTSLTTNQPPTVTLTSPASGSSFTAPASVTLSASASDPEGRLSRVEFYVGSTLVATDTASPYSTTWSTSTAGTYAIKAVAYDADGGTATSATSTITVASSQGGSAVRLIQHAGIDAGSTTTTSVPFGVSNTAGNWIGVAIRAGQIGQTFTVMDTQGNTYRPAAQVSESVDGTTMALYYAENIAGGANTVTVSDTLGGMLRVAILEYAGIALSSSLDVARTAVGTSATPSSGSVTTTASGDLVLGVISTANPATFTSGSGFVAEEGVPVAPNTKLLVEDQVQASMGAVTASATLGASDVWSALVATFRTGVSAAAIANQPPTVTLTSPASGSSFTAPATVALSANASDPENRMARVEFYVGNTLVATDTASPYTASWSTSTAGTYAIKAIAYDADGGSATSATSTITVTSSTSTTPTTVVFQASADHYTLVTSYRLDIFANGATPGSATPVASSDLGKPTPDANGDITVDCATFFSALAPATYIATVSAIGSGGESRSAAITFVR